MIAQFRPKFSVMLSTSIKTFSKGPHNLVVLHGLMGSKTNFRSIFQNSLITHHVNSTHLLDLRNHGESPHTNSMTLADMGQDIQEYIAQLDNVILIGHSLGGRSILQFLKDYRTVATEKVKGVVIVDILPGRVESDYVITLLDKLIKISLNDRTYNQLEEEIGNAAESKPIAQLLMSNLKSESPVTNSKDIITIENHVSKFKWRINIAGIHKDFQLNLQTTIDAKWSGPNLFIYGLKSKYVNSDNLRQLNSVFPHPNIHSIDCGHWVHAEKPKEFTELIHKFILSI